MRAEDIRKPGSMALLPFRAAHDQSDGTRSPTSLRGHEPTSTMEKKNPRAINSAQFTLRLGFIWPLHKFPDSMQEQMKEALLDDHYSANCFRNVPCT